MPDDTPATPDDGAEWNEVFGVGSAVSAAGDKPAPPGPATGPAAAPADTGYTDAGVPTLEGVRDKIESRYGTALGATELAEETPEGRAAADRYQARQQAAREKLEEIRASMRDDE